MNQEERQIRENKLLELIKQGNRLAFNELFEIYWKDLFSYSYKILSSKELAEDAVQNVFLKFWSNKEKLEIHNLKSYLYNAARNTSISLIRKSRFTDLSIEILQSLTVSASVEEKLNYEDLKKNIETATQGLPERCKEIFYLSRVKHYSIDEIAKKFNISKRTVENQISLALKHIRPQLINVTVMLPFILFVFSKY